MIIELGSDSDYARAVQRIIGLRGTDVDGKIGPQSVAKMRAWQASRGVEADGVFGPVSRAAVQPGDFIKAYEGLVLQAYDDKHGPLKDRLLHREGQVWRRADGGPCLGNPTIGWGRLLQPGEWVEHCTREEADLWFTLYLKARLADYMMRYFPRGRDAACREAVHSVGYNGGPGAIVKLANNNFSREWWHNHPLVPGAGLEQRRREECALWSAGEAA